LVDILRTSVCGTQLGEIRGTRGRDRFLPHCMGHEGVGIVRSVGTKMDRLKPGDHVYLTWIPCDSNPSDGKTYLCKSTGGLINSGPVVSFARSVVCSGNRLFPISQEIVQSGASYDAFTPLGCAYATAFGMVHRTANMTEEMKSKPVAVVGVGGVGLATSIFLGLAGFENIVIFDSNVDRKDKVLHLLNTMKICSAFDGQECSRGAGFSRVFECSGTVSGTEFSYAITSTAGLCIFSGNIPYGSKISIDPFDFLLGKRVVGAGRDNSKPAEDFPRIEQLVLANLPVFQSIISPNYEFENLNSALFDFEFMSVQRPVIRCD